MPTLNPSDTLREAIHMAFAEKTMAVADGQTIAAMTLGQGREVAARLTPILGPRGVEALFKRTAQLTRPFFPWLPGPGEPLDGLDPLGSFRMALESENTIAARDASLTFMVNFTGLLTTLIGPSLTERLLGPVWGLPPAPPAKENGHGTR